MLSLTLDIDIREQHESVLLILADKSVAALDGKRRKSGHSRVII